MFFIVGLIALALALAIATIFGLQLHPEAVQDVHLVVLTIFASPAIATVYGGLTLIVCNLICSRLGWPELSLPWWPQRPSRAAGSGAAYRFLLLSYTVTTRRIVDTVRCGKWRSGVPGGAFGRCAFIGLPKT